MIGTPIKYIFLQSAPYSSRGEKTIRRLLDLAEITVGGSNPWDIQVNNDNLYKRVLREGSIGLGESYMEGWWDSERLDEFFNKVFDAKLEEKVSGKDIILEVLKAKLFNRQSKKRAFEVGEKHYDTGNDLYRAMLDDRMTYTCGYWKDAKNLDKAQEDKLDLTCKKIGLEKGMRVLDVGCGWGSFAKYAAEKYEAEVVGVTVSREQVRLGKELCDGLPIDIRLQDYREIDGKFDRIVSLGMFEHVGPKNYKTYMKTMKKNLKDDGLFLLHTIGGNVSTEKLDPWMNKYIFPNAVLPSVSQIAKASEGELVMRDWHNFGSDYDKTLMAWNKNFQEAWPELSKNYSEKFKRMWKYYLLSCAGGFRAGANQLWQIVFSKEGEQGNYIASR